MIAALRRAWDGFRGSGHAAVTVPPMDGALRPNQILEQAPRLAALKDADNLVSHGGKIFLSSGTTVFELDPETGATQEVTTIDSPVSALAAAADGSLAIAGEDGRVMIRGGQHDGKTVSASGGPAFNCPTALLFLTPDELVIAEGSARQRVRDWKFDLMQHGATGSVTLADLGKGGGARIAAGLAWPSGLVIAADGSIAVSESWRHRIILCGRNGGKPRSVFEDLPGYPGRIAPSADGGYWLSVFAPRSQLIEFVLREKDFLRHMMSEVEPDYWVAPSLIASHTFLEPLQGGAQIHLGMLKPWAPTRSYGLLVKLDSRFQPSESFHSRADGKRHGITSCVEAGGCVLVTSRSAGDIAALPVSPPQPVTAMEDA